MGRRGGKVKVMKVSAGGSSEDVKDLHKMFAQITGTSDADRDVIIPKIISIYKLIIGYSKLFNILLSFDPFVKQFEEYDFWFEEIKTFLKDLVKSTDTDLQKDYSIDMSSAFHAMDNETLNTFYRDLKENPNIKKIVITGSNLVPHKRHLTETMDDVFIKREPGLTFQPFAFSTLDLKIIWNTENISDKAKTFMMSILRRAYDMGVKLYDIITSPDVDIKKFSKLLVDSIGKMKKMIPRCDNAFAIIERSVSMLEDNFKSYFRGSVEAGNPSIIIESFIVDLSKSQKASASVTNEFRRIVMVLKERGSQNTDPKVKKLFSMLNSKFSAIDSEFGIKTTDDKLDAQDDQENEINQTNDQQVVESFSESEVEHVSQTIGKINLDMRTGVLNLDSGIPGPSLTCEGKLTAGSIKVNTSDEIQQGDVVINRGSLTCEGGAEVARGGTLTGGGEGDCAVYTGPMSEIGRGEESQFHCGKDDSSPC